MTPKEKAEDIICQMYETDGIMLFEDAKYCALVAAELAFEVCDETKDDYWREVVEEIKKRDS